MARLSSFVPEPMLKRHGLFVFQRKTGSGQEANLGVQKGFQKVGDRVGRIGMIAVQRDDDISLGLHQTCLVSPAVASDLFMKNPSAEILRPLPPFGPWNRYRQR